MTCPGHTAGGGQSCPSEWQVVYFPAAQTHCTESQPGAPRRQGRCLRGLRGGRTVQTQRPSPNSHDSRGRLLSNLECPGGEGKGGLRSQLPGAGSLSTQAGSAPWRRRGLEPQDRADTNGGPIHGDSLVTRQTPQDGLVFHCRLGEPVNKKSLRCL